MRSIASLFFKLAGRTAECIQKGGEKNQRKEEMRLFSN